MISTSHGKFLVKIKGINFIYVLEETKAFANKYTLSDRDINVFYFFFVMIHIADRFTRS